MYRKKFAENQNSLHSSSDQAGETSHRLQAESERLQNFYTPELGDQNQTPDSRTPELVLHHHQPHLHQHQSQAQHRGENKEGKHGEKESLWKISSSNHWRGKERAAGREVVEES